MALPPKSEVIFAQTLKHQQGVIGRKLAILVLPTNDWPTIRLRAEEIAAKVGALRPGHFLELDWPE